MGSPSENSMISKTCKDCYQEKFLDQFYKHSGMKDGYINTCKECKKKYMANRPKERLRDIDRKRNKKPKRQEDKRKQSRKYKRNNIDKIRLATQVYRKKNPKKYRAHTIVNNAIKAGQLIKQPCEICKSTDNLEAHHDDYDKPLCVRWFCHKHHSELHYAFLIEKNTKIGR